MAQAKSPRRLDVAVLAREGGHLAGDEPLTGFPRLAEVAGGAAPAAGAASMPATGVRWAAQAALRRGPTGLAPWLDVQAEATVRLTCQRCLSPLDLPVQIQRGIRFVPDEAQAEAEDAQSDEDVLSLEQRLNLIELIEDELLLALPFAPRHDVCPDGRVASESQTQPVAEPTAARRQAFADLDKLKRL